MTKFLSGKKTHSLGTGMIMLGVLTMLRPELPSDVDAPQIIAEGLGFIFLRLGITKAAAA